MSQPSEQSGERDIASGSVERVTSRADEPEPEPEPEPMTVAALDEPVTVSLDIRLASDRRMHVAATTNLPEGTRVQLRVVREASNVRWQSRTEVREGSVAAGPYGPGSGLPDGYYRIELVTAPADVQPAEVKARIGPSGEHLGGPLVATSEHGLGKIIKASQRFLVGQEVRRTLDDVEVQQSP
ncbi:MAG: hypothetical protein GYB17_13630 [Gammaproteobacteria bacterium]|uniref:hypothetical protein n=1 Tax=Halomonas sp. BN3-1 TaxID=2082393 RepID=UPI0013B428D4|nr:hypothetical protein [Halomonas sp. BN3-1]MBR9880525.1 hypothetical protein [Gammaproteobacteria bacterium]